MQIQALKEKKAEKETETTETAAPDPTKSGLKVFFTLKKGLVSNVTGITVPDPTNLGLKVFLKAPLKVFIDININTNSGLNVFCRLKRSRESQQRH